MKEVVELIRFKETPGTWRYAELHDGDEKPVLGNIYLKKSAMADPKNPPNKLRVTVEAV
jgi:hypothetical protein